MIPVLKRSVPPRMALGMLSLALLASVVTGSELASNMSDVVEPVQRTRSSDIAPLRSSAPDTPTTGVDALDIPNVQRPQLDGASSSLFGVQSWAAPAHTSANPAFNKPSSPPAPPVPSAPPLPFKYLGRMIDGDKTLVFLSLNQDTLSAGAGDTLSNAYRLERIDESSLAFTYLPLGIQQTLSIPSQP